MPCPTSLAPVESSTGLPLRVLRSPRMGIRVAARCGDGRSNEDHLWATRMLLTTSLRRSWPPLSDERNKRLSVAACVDKFPGSLT